MEKELAAVGWHAEFFPAIRIDDAAGFPSVGARGCFLSHLAVLRKACAAGVSRLVILEDDVNFARGFAAQWVAAMSELERHDWSIFYAGHVLDDLPAGLSRLASDTGVRCAHFMAVHGHALAPLIAGLGAILSRPAGHPLGGPMHVDGAYSTIRAQNQFLITYVYSPALGYQRPSRTDIVDPRWFDRLAVVHSLANVARQLKARSRRAGAS